MLAARHLLVGLLTLLPFAAAAAAAAKPRGSGPGDTLHALLEREWEYQLQRWPTYASVLGDRRFNARWDDLSAEGIEADHRHNQQVLEALRAIDRAQLEPADRLNYDLLERDYQTWVEEHDLRWHLLPVSHMSSLPEGVHQPPGVQVAYQLADTLRFATEQDYEDWVARLEAFPKYVEQTMALMRQGIAEKRVHPRAVVQRIPKQLEQQLVEKPEDSGFYKPFKHFPDGVGKADQARLAKRARRAIEDGVLPALERFHGFVASEYLTAAPEAAGLGERPDGKRTYVYFARRFTTTRLTPDQIHELGLAEVKRLREEMERIKEQVGFAGPLADFFAKLRTEPRFYYRTGEELLVHYRDLAKRIDPKLVRLFKTLPRQPYGVEPTPEVMAPDATTGFYYPGAADGSRPGTYLVNLYKPETRPRWEMVPLTLHEAVPGHHLQVALAAEQEDLPAFRRHGSYVAYGEGWALYCETLGDELGLYDDPYDKFGQLSYEMWRAVRLVVDTGMHARKWTREKAIQYFLENSPRQELDVTNEVDRYIAMPGQALAYKLGQLKIRELREKAEKALGRRFDVRVFHDVVLRDGSLPLDVLERRVEAWLDGRRKQGS